jgi:hypothetical protein
MEGLRRQATAEQNQLRQILNADRGPIPDFEQEMRRLQKDLDPEDPLSKNRRMKRMQYDLDPEDPLHPTYGVRHTPQIDTEWDEDDPDYIPNEELDPEDSLARRRRW